MVSEICKRLGLDFAPKISDRVEQILAQRFAHQSVYPQVKDLCSILREDLGFEDIEVSPRFGPISVAARIPSE